MIELRGEDIIHTEGCMCGGDMKLVDLRPDSSLQSSYEERKWRCQTCDEVELGYHEIEPHHNRERCLPGNRGICVSIAPLEDPRHDSH